MKRLLLFFLLVIGIGLLSYLLTVNLKPDPEGTDFLPTDTLAVLEGTSIARTWAGWRQSDIGRLLNTSDVPQFFEQLGVPSVRIAEYKTLAAALDRLTSASLFSSLFAKKTVVALLAALPGRALDEQSLRAHLVLITPLGTGFSPQQLQLERYFGPLRSTVTTVYQGVPLMTLIFQSGQTFNFCQYRGVVICALNAQSVQRCIDQSLNRMVQTRSGLHLNPEYQRLKKRAGVQADFFLYADLGALLRQSSAALLAPTRDMALLPHHFALYHQAAAGHDRLSIIAQFPQEQLKAFTDRYQLVGPVENAVRQQISPETQLSFWTNWFHPHALWQLGLEMGGREITELMSSLAESLFEETGQTIDDFFDVFGNRFGVFINEQRVAHQSTRSVAGLYVEVRDQQKVDGMLKQLLDGLQVVKVLTSGTEIVSVVMAGGLLTPAYALLDNSLMIADSVGLIEQVQQQGGIKPTSGAKALLSPWEQADNFILFVRTRSVAERLVPLLTVLSKETADAAKILSPRNRFLIAKALIPLLTSLQSMETCSVRGYAAGDEMMLELDLAASGAHSRIFTP